MSTKSTSPPQTYSRLFRPWDGAARNEVEHEDMDKSALKVSLEIKMKKPAVIDGLSDRLMSEKYYDKFVPHMNSAIKASVISEMAFSSAKSVYDNLMPAHPIDYSAELPFYNSSPKCSDMMPLPFNVGVGMDPYTIGIMEQEYARIMAEEARTKALNARKQRPKKFKCPHCDVAFSNNGQLKGHIRIHTGERPFKCDDASCGKTFTRNEELTRHKRIHTGLRPFACPTCGKRFGRRDHLKKHTKTHMQERYMSPAVLLPMYPPYLYGY